MGMLLIDVLYLNNVIDTGLVHCLLWIVLSGFINDQAIIAYFNNKWVFYHLKGLFLG